MSVDDREILSIGWGICGSFCTIARAAEMMERLINDFRSLPKPIDCAVTPVVSFSVQQIDTRFGRAADIVARIEEICGRRCICTIEDAEPLGPKIKLDAFVIAPCTGNTLAKIARGINDTPVTMAVKAHLRNDSPTLIALASNDALSANLYNIAALLERKHVFFVPFGQDDPQGKPHSLIADFALMQYALVSAILNRQLQPLLLGT